MGWLFEISGEVYADKKNPVMLVWANVGTKKRRSGTMRAVGVYVEIVVCWVVFEKG